MKHFIYSVHTFECELRLTETDYNILVNIIYSTAKGNYPINPGFNGIWVYRYARQGLQIQLYKNRFNHYCIRITVNPKTVLCSKNTCNIFDPQTDSLDIVFKRVNEMLAFMGKLYRIENFELKRIDLCMDAKCQDDTTVEEYIRLSKKGLLPYGYRDRLPLFIRTKKKINPMFSCDMINLQGTQITLYNKYQQLLDIKTPEDIAIDAYGTLRIEVKLFNSWLERHLERYNLDNPLTSPELISCFIQNSQTIIHEHINKICFSGTHYKLEETIHKIQLSSIKEKYKKILIAFIQLIAKYHSSQLAEKYIIENFDISKATLQRALQALSSIGINPVTIGKNRQHSCLEGLQEMLGITHP